MNYIFSLTNENGRISDPVYRPKVFNNSDAQNRTELQHLLESNECLKIVDPIGVQLRELAECRNPGVQLSEADHRDFRASLPGYVTEEEFGLWVFYPWNNTLVHLLPEELFV